MEMISRLKDATVEGIFGRTMWTVKTYAHEDEMVFLEVSNDDGTYTDVQLDEYPTGVAFRVGFPSWLKLANVEYEMRISENEYSMENADKYLKKLIAKYDLSKCCSIEGYVMYNGEYTHNGECCPADVNYEYVKFIEAIRE